MPKINIEGYIPQETLKENVDKLKEILGPYFNITISCLEDTKKEFSPMYSSVQDYCKMNRCWAAKDSNGKWYWYSRNDRPYYHYARCEWLRNTIDSAFNKITNKIENVKFPDVLPDKSLVAPDGRLILMEGKKQKKKKEAKFKAGKWYKNKITGVILYCKIVAMQHIISGAVSVNGPNVAYYIGDLSDWYEMKHYKPNKKKKKNIELKRGEPIFVWDKHHNASLPVVVKYFHSFEEDAGVFTCNESVPNEAGMWYAYYRKFDPKLVGIPRKDWPKKC